MYPTSTASHTLFQKQPNPYTVLLFHLVEVFVPRPYTTRQCTVNNQKLNGGRSGNEATEGVYIFTETHNKLLSYGEIDL